MAALFDLDHTLFKVNSSFRFGLYLNACGIVSNLRMFYLIGSYCQHKAGFLSFRTLHQRAYRSMTGFPMARLRVMIDDWLAKEWDAMISLPILQELEKAQKENAFTAILSNSPDFIVEPISRKLKVDGWLATRYRSDANGGLSELHSMIEGKDKADYIDKLSREKGIPRSSIAAYSDSIHDLPFLLKAGCPVAVNPDRSLKSHCMRNRWKIIQVE